MQYLSGPTCWGYLVKSIMPLISSCLARLPGPRFTAALFKQLNVAHDHASVDGFTHVVDGEESDLGGGECFHFNAGGSGGLGSGLTINRVT